MFSFYHHNLSCHITRETKNLPWFRILAVHKELYQRLACLSSSPLRLRIHLIWAWEERTYPKVGQRWMWFAPKIFTRDPTWLLAGWGLWWWHGGRMHQSAVFARFHIHGRCAAPPAGAMRSVAAMCAGRVEQVPLFWNISGEKSKTQSVFTLDGIQESCLSWKVSFLNGWLLTGARMVSGTVESCEKGWMWDTR